MTSPDDRTDVREAIPLPGQSVDVIISNCVINLSAIVRGARP